MMINTKLMYGLVYNVFYELNQDEKEKENGSEGDQVSIQRSFLSFKEFNLNTQFYRFYLASIQPLSICTDLKSNQKKIEYFGELAEYLFLFIFIDENFPYSPGL